MDDLGAKWTDERIAELEERIVELFSEAHSDTYEKYMSFVRRFERDDKKYTQQLKDGKITSATYRDWLRGQVFQRRRWQKKLADMAATLAQTNQIAMDIINDAAPGVFTMNANWAAFEIEKAGNANMGFELYSEDTVKRLLRDEPELLPPSRVDIPEDERWNMKAITRQINAGIVTGEGLEDIAKRLMRVATMNANQARTHARTAMTGAQNAGRIETYRRAETMGIQVEKEWLATLDTRTRHAHAALDGKHVPVDEPFRSELGPIMYPGDPDARPANVYNCRCTLIAHLPKYPAKDARRRPNLQEYGDALVQKPIKDMTYAEWAKWKTKTQLKNAAGHVIIKAKKTTKKAAPNSIVQVENKKGGIDRNYYDENGDWVKQISNNDHGQPKHHRYGKHGEHAHDITVNPDGSVSRTVRELTEKERREEADIL